MKFLVLTAEIEPEMARRIGESYHQATCSHKVYNNRQLAFPEMNATIQRKVKI